MFAANREDVSLKKPFAENREGVNVHALSCENDQVVSASPHVVHTVIHAHHRLFLECVSRGISTPEHTHTVRQIANDHVICPIVSPADYRIHTVPVALLGELLAEGSVSGEAAWEEIGELGKQVLPAGDDQINTGTLSSHLRCVLKQGNA